MPKDQKIHLNHNKSYQIYALTDPRDGAIRYVGLSFNAQVRLYGHLMKTKTNKQKALWIESLRQIGMSPTLQILETIDAGPGAYLTACVREQIWIDKMSLAGAPLLNILGVSHTYRRAPSPPTRAQSRPKIGEIEASVSRPKTDYLTVEQIA